VCVCVCVTGFLPLRGLCTVKKGFVNANSICSAQDVSVCFNVSLIQFEELPISARIVGFNIIIIVNA